MINRRETYTQYCQRLPISKDRGNHPSDFDSLTPEEQNALCYWIQTTIAHSKRVETRTSYGMKHDFEFDGFYINNGQFKGAMLISGFTPIDEQELNWTFRIKPRVKKSTLHFSQGREVYVPDEVKYSLAGFDKTFAALLIKSGHLERLPI